jgi:hypothetical protein
MGARGSKSGRYRSSSSRISSSAARSSCCLSVLVSSRATTGSPTCTASSSPAISLRQEREGCTKQGGGATLASWRTCARSRLDSAASRRDASASTSATPPPPNVRRQHRPTRVRCRPLVTSKAEGQRGRRRGRGTLAVGGAVRLKDVVGQEALDRVVQGAECALVGPHHRSVVQRQRRLGPPRRLEQVVVRRRRSHHPRRPRRGGRARGYGQRRQLNRRRVPVHRYREHRLGLDRNGARVRRRRTGHALARNRPSRRKRDVAYHTRNTPQRAGSAPLPQDGRSRAHCGRTAPRHRPHQTLAKRCTTPVAAATRACAAASRSVSTTWPYVTLYGA